MGATRVKMHELWIASIHSKCIVGRGKLLYFHAVYIFIFYFLTRSCTVRDCESRDPLRPVPPKKVVECEWRRKSVILPDSSYHHLYAPENRLVTPLNYPMD